MSDLEVLAQHRAFYDDLMKYLPQNETREEEPPQKNPPEEPADNPPPKSVVADSAVKFKPKVKKSKVRPGFEGTKAVRQKRSK